MAVATAHRLEAKQFKSVSAKLDGISEKTMTEHYKLYQGYVNKYNEVMEKLAAADKSKANQVFSDVRSLKVDLTFAIGGVKNHEIYFAHLGGKSPEPSGRLKAEIEKWFGSVDNWRADMKATGMAARGWGWLAWDWDYHYLFNYAGDAQNTFPVWNATPLVALDVYEHAYYLDYQVNRAAYIDAFFKNLNWEVVAQSFEGLQKAKAA